MGGGRKGARASFALRFSALRPLHTGCYGPRPLTLAEARWAQRRGMLGQRQLYLHDRRANQSDDTHATMGRLLSSTYGANGLGGLYQWVDVDTSVGEVKIYIKNK